jgi:hypothetical protein
MAALPILLRRAVTAADAFRGAARVAMSKTLAAVAGIARAARRVLPNRVMGTSERLSAPP